MNKDKQQLFDGLLKDIDAGVQTGVVSDRLVFDLVTVPMGPTQQARFDIKSQPALERLYNHFAHMSFLEIDSKSDEPNIVQRHDEDIWGGGTLQQLVDDYELLIPIMAQAGTVVVAS